VSLIWLSVFQEEKRFRIDLENVNKSIKPFKLNRLLASIFYRNIEDKPTRNDESKIQINSQEYDGVNVLALLDSYVPKLFFFRRNCCEQTLIAYMSLL
jgi:hypothetical protein